MSNSKISPELADALRRVTELSSGKIMVTIVPDGVTDEFCDRLRTYISFLLDIRLPGPMILPAVQKGNGLECPYCHIPVTGTNMKALEQHARKCDFRMAVTRWALEQIAMETEYAQ